MSYARTLPRTTRDPLAWMIRLLLLGVAASTALLASASAFVVGTRLAYWGRALPGVRVAGVEVGGRTAPEIERMLGASLTYPDSGLVVLRDGEQLWALRPADLGLRVDHAASARRALAAGRAHSLGEQLHEQITAWIEGLSVAPVIVHDQAIGALTLRGLAQQIDRPTQEATLSLEGLEVVARRGQVGRRLEVGATLAALGPVLRTLRDQELALIVIETPPAVLDASPQAGLARTILSAPLRLTALEAGPWTIEPPELAAMLDFEMVHDGEGARYRLVLDATDFGARLAVIAPTVERAPENARFIFNDDTRQLDLLREAMIGRRLDVAGTLAAVNDGLNAGLHEIGLVFETQEPAVGSAATAAELGISENVAAVSTYFAGSSAGRIQNIRVAAGAFHGLLVAPGETFSMARALGDISLDAGYTEALIIYGNRTISGVGGGVCQVSTTLFRAAFFGGYQIDERHPHAYRVMYYESGPGSPGPGMDATVFVPLVDFRFTNDTPYWLLMETYIYGNQLLWKFYSTGDGRQVQWSSSGPRSVVEAEEPLYRENDELRRGEIRQVDFEADGMDVTVNRSVRRGDAVLHQDVIRTRYLPWRAIFEYGPGTELPEDARTE